MESLLTLARLTFLLVQTIYDAHSEHARAVRAVPDVISYYVRYATFAYVPILIQICSLWFAPNALRWGGIECDLDKVPRLAQLRQTSPYVQDQNHMAKHVTAPLLHQLFLFTLLHSIVEPLLVFLILRHTKIMCNWIILQCCGSSVCCTYFPFIVPSTRWLVQRL